MRNCFEDTTPDDRIKTGPEARQTLADPLNINTYRGGEDMSHSGQYTDSTSGNNRNQSDWQSVGRLGLAVMRDAYLRGADLAASKGDFFEARRRKQVAEQISSRLEGME